MDTPEEHSESEAEREEDALLELGEDGLPTDGENGLPADGGLASKGASERPCAVGRPVATPQLRSCEPPQNVAVPPAPVATESYEHLGSVSSLCDALDGKLHIGENDAPQDS